MRVNDLKSAKMMFVICLLLFAGMVFLGQDKATPVMLKGVVSALLEENDVLRAAAVEVDGERYVVKFTNEFLLTHTPPVLKKFQEVELMATKFKAVKQGVTCEFVELVKAGNIREDLAKQENEALTVDELKNTLSGYKGM